MAPVIHIDVPWLLQRHEEVLPDQPTVNDFSALVAAVARHRALQEGAEAFRRFFASHADEFAAAFPDDEPAHAGEGRVA